MEEFLEAIQFLTFGNWTGAVISGLIVAFLYILWSYYEEYVVKGTSFDLSDDEGFTVWCCNILLSLLLGAFVGFGWRWGVSQLLFTVFGGFYFMHKSLHVVFSALRDNRSVGFRKRVGMLIIGGDVKLENKDD